MRAWITVLATAALCGSATAESAQYTVDELAAGTKLNFNSASYREYKCSRSEQFDGLTWCQKTHTSKEQRGSYTTAYSILHARDGNVLYVNRSQNPAFLNGTSAEQDIKKYSDRIGGSPRIIKMPHRNGGSDGLMAVWGSVTLEPLDQESIRILAGGKKPKKGLLIDFLGDFVRSAKEGLPVYRIDGGPGFIWAANFNQKGSGTLRLTALGASGFLSPLPEQRSTQQASAEETSVDRTEAEVKQTGKPEAQAKQPDLQTIEKLQTELTIATTKIAELENARDVAEQALIEATQSKVDAEIAKSELARASAAEAKLKATITRLEAEKDDVQRWKTALYGGTGGLLVVLTTSAVGFFMNRRKASVLNQPAWEAGTNLADVSARSQTGEAETMPYASSPEIVIAEAAFGRELEEQVAAINATQHGD